jgi:hypothetical protein
MFDLEGDNTLPSTIYNDYNWLMLYCVQSNWGCTYYSTLDKLLSVTMYGHLVSRSLSEKNRFPISKCLSVL